MSGSELQLLTGTDGDDNGISLRCPGLPLKDAVDGTGVLGIETGSEGIGFPVMSAGSTGSVLTAGIGLTARGWGFLAAGGGWIVFLSLGPQPAL